MRKIHLLLFVLFTFKAICNSEVYPSDIISDAIKENKSMIIISTFEESQKDINNFMRFISEKEMTDLKPGNALVKKIFYNGEIKFKDLEKILISRSVKSGFSTLIHGQADNIEYPIKFTPFLSSKKEFLFIVGKQNKIRRKVKTKRSNIVINNSYKNKGIFLVSDSSRFLQPTISDDELKDLQNVISAYKSNKKDYVPSTDFVKIIYKKLQPIPIRKDIKERNILKNK